MPGRRATLPIVLAVGHEFQLGTYLGPPLAFWLAELAFDLAGRSLFGVYLLSQACVVVTYWAVFALGRSIVGAQHAALAVLLMVGRRRLHGADAGLRAGHPHHAAVGDHPAALLARGRRRPAGLLAAARGRDRAAAAHDLCRADPGRAARAVHAGEQARARRAQLVSTRCSRRSSPPSSCARI